MTDTADMADELVAEHLAAGLRMARVPVPDGVAGPCDDCGENMPRLVDGLCGYCRDGRAPPVDRLEARPAPVLTKETSMANPAGGEARQVTFTAKGATLRAIETIAEEDGIGMGRAALNLVEAALADPPAADAAAKQSPPVVDLATVHLDALLEAVRLRVERAAADDPKLAAALARADAAERALANIRAALA